MAAIYYFTGRMAFVPIEEETREGEAAGGKAGRVARGPTADLCSESTTATLVFVLRQPGVYIIGVPPRASAYIQGRFRKWRKAYSFVFDIRWRSRIKQNACLKTIRTTEWGLRVGLNLAPTVKRAFANTEPDANVIR
jgi:hypothetical protein